VPVQFVNWMEDLVVHGNMRESFQYVNHPVSEIISESLPVSIELGALALLFCAALGVPLGVLAASRPHTWLDTSSMFLAITGLTLPSYLSASLLILVFSTWLGWLPPALWEDKSSIILPVIALGLRPLGIIARLTRSAMLEALNEDYIRTAYSKGLSERIVLYKHAFRNSLIPIVTVMGPLAANLITGSFVIETVFQLPGIGKHFIQAVMNRDYPLIMGVTLVYGAILLLANLLIDLLYGWIDPRIRMGGAR
jgi:ABC-type dipeptide/oligopeptide/nickel transport system permease component